MASAAPNTSSELASKLIQSGLDGAYWADIFETKLGVTLPQQIEFLEQEHLQQLKDAIRHGWEEKALRKCIGIKQTPGETKSEMVAKLNEAGLDGTYWTDILEKKLGILRLEQTRNLTVQHLAKLKDAMKHDWEENTLRQFLNIETYGASIAKQQEKNTKRQQEAQQLLQEIKQLKETGVSHADEMMKAKGEQLRQVLDVPKEQWVETYDNVSLDTMIGQVSSGLGDLGKLAEGRKDNTASDILANASGGLALRGVLVGCTNSRDFIKRIVLSTPTDVTLMNPMMQQVDKVVQFSSKTQSDHFQSSFDTMGYSVAASIKGSRWGFSGEAGFSKKHESEEDKQSEDHNQTAFESRIMYSVVPTAACELNPSSLRLSQEAMVELKLIDKVLTGVTDDVVVDEKCKRFFNTYGSHINAGVLHFGGSNKFNATYSSETTSKADTTKAMVRDALSAYASMSYSGFGCSVGGSVSADHMKSHGSFEADYNKSEQAKTSLNTTRNGGPQEVAALPLWKMGLVTCNSTWALIDRGIFAEGRTDFVGIWQLISNHMDEFPEPQILASKLKGVWEQVNGHVSTDSREQQALSAISMMDQLRSSIVAWNSVSISASKCLDHLQMTLKTVEDAERLTGSNKYWVDIVCMDGSVSGFLRNVVEMKDAFASKDVSLLRFLLRKLMAPVGHRDFPGKEKIIKWAAVNLGTEDIPTMLANACIQTIPNLVVFLKERFIPTLEIEHSKNTEGTVQRTDNINTAATVDMALSISRLLKYLQSSGDVHLVVFMKAVLLQLDYDWSFMRFQTLLTMEKLDHFVQYLDKGWTDFKTHKDKGQVQLESYLVQMSIASGQFQTGQQGEDDFSDLVKDIRQVLSPQVNAILNRFATSSPYDWTQLVHLAGELAHGNMSVIEDKEVEIPDLKEAFDHHSNLHKEEMSKATHSSDSLNEAYSYILNILGLQKYYPSQITMLDAMTIRKGTDEISDLPWKIIQKLLMINFYARDQPVSACNESDHFAEKEQGLDELADFLEESYAYDDGEQDERKLSTLDIIVVIFGCCDNFLKQVLAQKLFVCKLAIPYLYPLGSPGSVAMSLWALRTIIVDWHDTYNEPSETPVTDKPFPIVTFVRLDRPPFSKSKLMNDVLCDQAHDTFLNHDCPNGTVERRVTEGLVECSWFIPAGNKSKIMPGTTMLLNLRGDASSHQKQMRILSKMSSVVVVIVSAKDFANEPNIETCKQITKAAKRVILLVIMGLSGNKQQLEAEKQAFVKAVGNDDFKGIKLISSTKHGAQKNASEMRTEVRNKLSEVLTDYDGITVEECASVAEEEGVAIDEYDTPCLHGKALAEQVINHMDGKESADCKGKLLPLQGTEWVEYSKLLKKQHRASGKAQLSSAYQADQLQQEMDRLRKRQVGICCHLTPFIKDFMTILDGNNEQVSLYFLHWMKLLLDRKSRLTLPALRKQYHAQWAHFQQTKNDIGNTSQVTDEKAKLKASVDQAEHVMSAASLGLENFFRELGQMYEAIHESSKIAKETRRIVEYLPELVAKLMVKGTPLELVDGDAANVPSTWIRAVLAKLGKIIGEDKRLFVLSVLGIQSSGKSTLLNTMFGLQFAVSAGRCTKGAYMQLVPVGKSANLPFDYIVVIDTEGLRAQGLTQDSHARDNELATLVIGLGDVTMINIKGENHAEMKDILQIAVHAFLRMNIVNKHIKNHRTSVFVHQNVPAANAKEMMMHGCQKLQESLDAMAKEAADSENIADIHSFSQIITFDVNEHVWYFSDLWHGDPPMAPANPGYSAKVDAVKLSLLERIAKSQTTFLTTSYLSMRLDDLWKGILADDFVFSFRNSLEMKAYNSLESTYYALEWKLQKSVMNWLQKTADIKIRKSEQVEDLEVCSQQLLLDLNSVITQEADEIKISLKEYFETSNLSDILIQWQQAKMNALSFAAEQRYNEGKSDLLSMKEARRIELLQTQNWAKHEIYIMEKAVKLAEKMKGRELTDGQMEDKFDTMWIPMVNELASKVPANVIRMDLQMERVLSERFHAHGMDLRDELKRQPLDCPPQHMLLEGSIRLEFVTEHDLSKTNWFRKQVQKAKSTLKEAFGEHLFVCVLRDPLEGESLGISDV